MTYEERWVAIRQRMEAKKESDRKIYEQQIRDDKMLLNARRQGKEQYQEAKRIIKDRKKREQIEAWQNIRSERKTTVKVTDRREYYKQYYKAHKNDPDYKAKNRHYNMLYRAKKEQNPKYREQRLEYHRQWIANLTDEQRENIQQKKRQQQRQYYLKHKEQILSKARKKREQMSSEERSEVYKKKKQRLTKTNREQRREYQHRYYLYRKQKQNRPMSSITEEVHQKTLENYRQFVEEHIEDLINNRISQEHLVSILLKMSQA